MSKSSAKRSAYELVLMQNSLSTMVRPCGDAIQGHGGCKGCSCSPICYGRKCQECRGNCKVLGAASGHGLELNTDEMLDQVSTVLQKYGSSNVTIKDTVDNVKKKLVVDDKRSVRSKDILPGMCSVITCTENKGSDKFSQEEAINRPNSTKLCQIINGNDDPVWLSITSSDYATIRPINFKKIQAISFRELISTKTEVVSSEDKLPVVIRKHEMNSNISSPCPLSCWSMSPRDRITATEVDDPLLRSLYDSSISTNLMDYNPNILNDFDSDYGARKTSTSVHCYPEQEAKRIVNEAFRLRFPQVHVSFTKINSIKRELHQIAVACDLEDCTTAHAYVFYEKVVLKVFFHKNYWIYHFIQLFEKAFFPQSLDLCNVEHLKTVINVITGTTFCLIMMIALTNLVLQGLVCKTNRKLVAGAALLIAAKITDFGSMRISDVVNYLESSLRINRKELLRYEIPLCAALSFDLRVPNLQLLPHYQRIALMIL
ncbi:unnamed protein product [Thelazia callipaeda]|uniref:Cyclin N-terminal domain-containing protein n=1 Tax=Thelazia callipaeda TaxID=103827 RepID=A0A158RCI9_THECL|nr:unnamed protein product [Thelazia callipaeda]